MDGPAHYRLLLIEDSDSDARLLVEVLREEPGDGSFAVDRARTLAQGLERLSTGTYDVVLLDLNLPDSSGYETFLRLSQASPAAAVVIMTATGLDTLARRAIAAGAQDFLFKDRLEPFWVNRALAHAVGRFRLLRRLQAVESKTVATAKAASYAKSAFLAAMNHEIRTPISAVLTAAELLGGTADLPTAATELIDVIRRNGTHLLGLVTDALDLAKIEAGFIGVTNVATDSQALVAEVLAMQRLTAVGRGISLLVQAPAGKVPLVMIDAAKVRQILTNLVANALRFTGPGGQVEVRYELLRAGPRPVLSMAVTDTGSGLSQEQQDRLFRPFSQPHLACRDQAGTTGLGLVVSRDLAGAMGGELGLATSSPGLGSTFKVMIPCELAPPPREHAERQAAGRGATTSLRPLAGRRLLVVDDNVDMGNLYRTLLERQGATVDVAVDSRAGIEQAVAGHFDVVLLDMNMPVLSGYEAATMIRAARCRTPIIAVTANALDSDEQRCRTAGCDAYVTKPLTGAALVTALLELIDPPKRPGHGEPRTSPASNDRCEL